MEKANLFSVNKAKAGLYGLSGYFKLDLPTGETNVCTCKTQLCQCGKSQNKPICDESHAKYEDEMVTPWF